MAVPVEEKPSASLQVTPQVSGAFKTIVSVNGAGSAGSRKVTTRGNTTGSQSEYTRFDVNSASECTITVLMQYGYIAADTKVSEPWHVRVIVDPDDDGDAYANLSRGYPDIRTVIPEVPLKIRVPSGVTAFYVVGITATGSTLAKCIGDIIVEIN